MWASILAFFKALAEFLQFGKWIYTETKKTESQKEGEIEASNGAEREQVKKEGRPRWDI